MPTISRLPEVPSLIKLARKKHVSLYLVGGYLRDQYLRRSKQDLDFIVSKGAIAFARAFARLSQGAFILLDAESGCARVARKIDGSLWTYDFADLRADTLAGDIKKRDFTINTLVVDLMGLAPDQEILSACLKNPKAMADIKARTIRMTGPAAFDEDPLRLLRAYSLSAQTGFKIDPRTLTAITSRVRLIRKASPERVRDELFKILETPRAALTIGKMEKSGLVFAVIPQLKLMAGVPRGGYHHLNVWKHSLLALSLFEKMMKSPGSNPELAEYLAVKVGGGHSRAALIKLACLLHDTGKPETRKEMPGGRLSFHGHERVGRDITRNICLQLKLSTAERYALEDMVARHLRPGYMANFKKAPERMVFRFLRDAREEASAVLLLSLCDQGATRGPLTTEEAVRHHEATVLPLIDLFFAKKKEKPFVRLIDGNDLIKELKLNPGPEFKVLLSAVDEAQYLRKVTTASQALEFVRNQLKGTKNENP